MSSERHPMNRKGGRNPFCSYYQECLDAAAKKMWTSLDCSECDYRTDRGSKVDITEYLTGDSMQVHDLPTGLDDQF